MTRSAIRLTIALGIGLAACSTSGPSTSITVKVISGSGQTIAVTDTAPEPFVVQVVDQDNQPVDTATVSFVTKIIGGFTTVAKTDANGMTQTRFFASTAVGADTITVTTANVTNKGIITITILPGPADTLRKLSGDGQIGAAGATLSFPLVIGVKDQYKNNVPNASVTWLSDNGTVSAPTTVTDSVGQTQVTFILPNTPGKSHITARIPGLTDAVFIATTR